MMNIKLGYDPAKQWTNV
jgi:hypothetical protein